MARKMKNQYKINKLKLKTRLMLSTGMDLEGWNCHHILPAFIKQDDSMDNLCYMEERKHSALHKKHDATMHLMNKEQLKQLALDYGALML